MLYYLGKGTEFKKEDCKEYKTIEGAMKAAAKDESFVVWDENGNVIGSLTDNVPEGALQTNPDGSVNTYDADGNKVGTVDAETVEKMTTFESDEDAAGQQDTVSDSDTAGQQLSENSMNPPEEKKAGDDYETPHPEGITSLCYSCTEYETCNVKTGTCTSCDQYKNRAEAYKTDEQRYSEEQDAIDRETKKKLREMEQEKKMQNLPSDTQETGQKVHQIRLAKSYFDDVANGIKTFELRKNDRGYKKGDILEMMEFADGKNTGRTVKVLVTYILEDYTGIEDGYCIMATKLMKDGEE